MYTHIYTTRWYCREREEMDSSERERVYICVYTYIDIHAERERELEERILFTHGCHINSCLVEFVHLCNPFAKSVAY